MNDAVVDNSIGPSPPFQKHQSNFKNYLSKSRLFSLYQICTLNNNTLSN